MNEIICPNCKKAFKVDEAGFADILKQVRDHQFEEEINNRLALAERDKETLVIVTSAYETGGYSVNPGSKREKLQHEFTGKATTGTLVPVFSQGPGAIKFTGFFENVDFLPRLKALFGWN